MAFDARIYQNLRPLPEYRDEAWKCVRCGFCRMTNPEKLKSQRWSDNCVSGTRFQFEPYFGSGKQEVIRALTTSPPELEVNEKLKHIAYTCTACGACQAICNPVKDLEPTNATVALREWLVREGYGPLPEHEPLIKSIQNYDNPWMQPRSARSKWAKRAKLKVKDITKERAEVLFYAGCNASYDPEFTKLSVAVVNILDSSGVDFGILGNAEMCCGSTVLRIGERDKFNTIRDKNIEQFHSLGIKTIITACAGCHSTISHEYTDFLEGMEVLHLAEYMDRLVEEDKLKFSKEVVLQVTYHDPCHIGRYSGIYDPPRRILEAIPGIDLNEMERIRDWSWCCGAGGGVRTAFREDVALWAAKIRIEEGLDTGARTMVTTCPFCEQNLAEAASAMGNVMRVVDLMQLCQEAL